MYTSDTVCFDGSSAPQGLHDLLRTVSQRRMERRHITPKASLCLTTCATTAMRRSTITLSRRKCNLLTPAPTPTERAYILYIT
eukprot:1348607-Amorphochlora_amoeboformis.AAC.2